MGYYERISLSCGMTTVKYALFVFNLLCAIAGLAFVIIGGIYVSQFGNYKRLFADYYANLPAIIIIILGLIIFLISFFGCCGAVKESTCMTYSYAAFLMVLIIIQIVLGAVVLINRTSLTDGVVGVYEKVFEEREVRPMNMELIDIVQEEFQCCGFKSPNEWKTKPKSCHSDKNVLYEDGCSTKLRAFIQRNSSLLGWVALGVVIIQILGFIFSCSLANSIRNNVRRTV